MRGNYMLSAVTKALADHFGGEIAVANETVIQDVPGEYLFASQINSEQKPSNWRFHDRFYFFDIRFHPDAKTQTQNKRMAEIAERLRECLAYIETDDQPVKAASMRTETQDGVLHFFVDYPLRVLLKPPADPKMLGLSIDENLKE